MGGHAGRKRLFDKAPRRVATRGLRIGKHVSIKYRDPDTRALIYYEGKFVDKRVGKEDRDSYIELKDCLRIDKDDHVVERVDKLRLMEPYIEEAEVIEPREDRDPISATPLGPSAWNAAPATAEMPQGLHTAAAAWEPVDATAASMAPMQAVPMMQMPMMMAPQGMQMMPMQMGKAGMQAGMQAMPMMSMQAMPQMMGGMMPMMMPMGGMMMAMPGMAMPASMAPAAQRERSRSRGR